jgi:hypothetical protein
MCDEQLKIVIYRSCKGFAGNFEDCMLCIRISYLRHDTSFYVVLPYVVIFRKKKPSDKQGSRQVDPQYIQQWYQQMYISRLKLVCIHSELLHVLAKHVTIFRDVKYKINFTSLKVATWHG